MGTTRNLADDELDRIVERGETNLLAPLEPVLLDFVIGMKECENPLNEFTSCELAMELIKGAPLEKALLDYQKRHRVVDATATETKMVGSAWYRGFMTRNQEKIRAGFHKRNSEEEEEEEVVSTFAVPDHLLPTSMPSSLEELRAICQKVHEAGFEAGRKAARAEMALAESQACELTVTVDPSSVVADYLRQIKHHIEKTEKDLVS